MLVAQNIEALMKAKGMDAAKLGRASELNATGIYDILSGKSQSPKIGTIAKIAKGLGVPVASIFSGDTDTELRNSLLAILDQLPEDQQALLLKTAEAWTLKAS